MLFFRYEGLVGRPAEHLQLLALFSGVRGIDARELEAKVNTFEGALEAATRPASTSPPQR